MHKTFKPVENITFKKRISKPIGERCLFCCTMLTAVSKSTNKDKGHNICKWCVSLKGESPDINYALYLLGAEYHRIVRGVIHIQAPRRLNYHKVRKGYLYTLKHNL